MPSCNESYFDSIDDENKAYWLGFLLADGGVYPHGKSGYRLTLKLKPADRHHVEAFASAISFNGTVGKHGVQICCRHLADVLATYNIVPKKAKLNLDVPSVPQSLEDHFWRGVLDGDGYIDICRPRIVLVGTQKICQSFLSYTQQWINTRAKVKPHSGSSAYDIEISGRHQVRILLKHIYQQSTIALPRKLESVRAIFNA